MDDRTALLRGVPLFGNLDETSLQAVAVLAREVTTQAGDVLMLEGEPGDAFYVILEGTLRVERHDRPVRSMTAGGFLGEIALLEGGPRTATVTCVTEARLLELRAHEFQRLLDRLPALRRRVLAAVERRGHEHAGPGS